MSNVVPGVVYTYKVKEMNDTPVRGTFYEQDLQKVQISDDALYRIEKVFKRQGNKVLVSNYQVGLKSCLLCQMWYLEWSTPIKSKK